MNSKFSDFFRLATPEEKERVWKEIARKSCEDQQEIINQANQMNQNEVIKSSFNHYIDEGKLMGYIIEFTYQNNDRGTYWIDFVVFSAALATHCSKERNGEKEWVKVNEDTEHLVGFVKFDGCMEVNNIHFCGAHSVMEEVKLIQAIYIKAKEVFGNNCLKKEFP